MKPLVASLLFALVACEQAPSKLDDLASPMPTSPTAAPVPGAAPIAADHGGTVEERLARLETTLAKYGPALEFLSQVYDQQKAQADAAEASEPAPDAVFAVPIAHDIAAGMVEGPATAPVTIVKAFDFACPYCMRANDTMKELVAQYGGKVRIVYKNLVVHEDTAMTGHLASCAAAKQGKYVAFKNAFWEKAFAPYAASRGEDAAKLGRDNILAFSKDLGLDPAKLAADMDSAACKQLIERDIADLAPFQVSATPTFFINGKLVAGALPKEAFEQIIDERLQVAQASGIAPADYYEREVMAKGEKKFRSKKDPKPQ